MIYTLRFTTFLYISTPFLWFIKHFITHLLNRWWISKLMGWIWTYFRQPWSRRSNASVRHPAAAKQLTPVITSPYTDSDFTARPSWTEAAAAGPGSVHPSQSFIPHTPQSFTNAFSDEPLHHQSLPQSHYLPLLPPAFVAGVFDQSLLHSQATFCFTSNAASRRPHEGLIYISLIHQGFSIVHSFSIHYQIDLLQDRENLCTS